MVFSTYLRSPRLPQLQGRKRKGGKGQREKRSREEGEGGGERREAGKEGRGKGTRGEGSWRSEGFTKSLCLKKVTIQRTGQSDKKIPPSSIYWMIGQGVAQLKAELKPHLLLWSFQVPSTQWAPVLPLLSGPHYVTLPSSAQESPFWDPMLLLPPSGSQRP